MVVPLPRAASSQRSILPPAISTRVPVASSSARVSSSRRETEDIDGRASPRKPKVAMESRSFTSRSLLVAWRSKASKASSRSMPQPSSAMRIRRRPPLSTSSRKDVAPASSEFSRSSLTTEAGRSTTSPAAILFATWSGRTRMRPTGLLYRHAAPVQQFAGLPPQIQHGTLVLDLVLDHGRFGIHQRLISLQHEEDGAGAQLVFLLLSFEILASKIERDQRKAHALLRAFELADRLRHIQARVLLDITHRESIALLRNHGIGEIGRRGTIANR